MHHLIGLRTIDVVGATCDILCILVEGKDTMNFVPVAFKAKLEDIVGKCCHRPVVGTDDAFIVVGKDLASHLCKEAVLRGQLGPCFVEIEASLAALPPDAAMLGSHFGFDVRTFVAQRQACSFHEELSAVLFCSLCEAAKAHLASTKHVQVHVDLILQFVLLCKSCRRNDNQQKS